MRESEAQAELRGERAAVVRGPEQPYFGRGVARRLRLDFGERVSGGQRPVEETDEILHLLRHAFRALEPAVHQRQRRARVATRRAAYSEIDPSGKERLQHAERLGDFQRAVVGQKHAPRPDANARGGGGDAADEDLRTRVGERRDGVVFRQPVTVIAQLLGKLGE
jgi:hypothetical protein